MPGYLSAAFIGFTFCYILNPGHPSTLLLFCAVIGRMYMLMKDLAIKVKTYDEATDLVREIYGLRVGDTYTAISDYFGTTVLRRIA